MRIRMLAINTALLLSSSGSAVASQEIPAVTPGARVRAWISQPADQKFVGTLLEIRGDTLFLQGEGRADTTRILRTALTRLDISAGQMRHTGTGAAAGFLIGGAGGALAGFLIANGQNCDGGCGGLGALLFGAIGAGSGLLIGTVVGGNTTSDRWQEVPGDRFRVGLLPQRNGRVAFVASVSF